MFRAIVDFVSPGGEGSFEALSLELFRRQYELNAPYRRFCDSKGAGPGSISSWKDIPAYPTDGFRNSLVVSFPIKQAVMAHITGGTTCPELRGRVFRDAQGRQLALECNARVMGEYIFPDLAAAGGRMSIMVLAPSPETAPSMGMALGMAETIRRFGTSGSRFFVTRSGMKTGDLLGQMRDAQRRGEPVALIGATGAFVYLLNACRERGVRFALPEGSRIVDGGGYRGKFGECTREEYYRGCLEVLGVPEHYCLNVLGMAECTTNFADSSLRDYLEGDGGPRFKPNHGWAKVLAFDAETCTRPLEDGKIGLLRHFDLANFPTVLAVQTDNLGYTVPGGFEIIGRAMVVDGKVSETPSEKAVGPMGESRVFSLLDAYMKFSINRHVAKLGRQEGGTSCTCGEVVEDMIDKPADELWEDMEL